MTTAEELKEEILEFIKEKREEITCQADEESLPFQKTIDDYETEGEQKYAFDELKKVINDKNDCESLLENIESWLEDNSTTSTNNQKNKA
jgi:hemerythrin superfamily protein